MGKRFSEELKKDAEKLYLTRGNAYQVAIELGIGCSTLQKWVKLQREQMEPVAITQAEELRALKKESARLEEEVAILKKQQRSSQWISFKTNNLYVH